MSRIIYVNGAYCAYHEAYIHVEDRGFQFADGVYEVCEVRNGHLIDETRHMQRLMRSLKELEFKPPMSLKSLGIIMRETVRRNRVRDGLVYLQITRGVARRDFIFPPEDNPCSVVCFSRISSFSKADALAKKGISVVTVPDIRWKRPDIKSVSLLPNALAKQHAKQSGAYEAWMMDEEGNITEGSSSNAYIVNAKGDVITRPAEVGILRGITRSVVFDLANREGIQIIERPFSLDEAEKAREAFLTSATSVILPVVRINDRTIGDGKPGPLAKKLRALFHTQAEIAG
ncbi:MAG: D-amino-acid transaminase [Methyloligellaceae bacterium]